MRIGASGDQPVGVEADPHPPAGCPAAGAADAGRASREEPRSATRSLGSVSLQVGRVPGNDVNRHARGREGARVIGDRPAPGVSLLDGRPERAEPRRLRGLGAGDLVALDRADHPRVADSLQRVDHRDDRHDGAIDRGRGG